MHARLATFPTNKRYLTRDGETEKMNIIYY